MLQCRYDTALRNQSHWTSKVVIALQNLPGSPGLDWDWSGSQLGNRKCTSTPLEEVQHLDMLTRLNMELLEQKYASTDLEQLQHPDMLICADGATVYIGADKVNTS